MGDKNFRLPLSIRPERYQFRVAPDLAAKRFAGSGTVEMVLDEAARAVTLHGVHLEVSSARFSIGSASRAATVTADAVSQTLSFASDGELPAGKLSLELEWSGIFHDDLRGFYLASGIAVTQFEAADARRVFPCFDEPSFKAVWELTLEVADSDASVISNSAIVSDEKNAAGRRVVRFGPTPRMSSYLVAMVLGELTPSAVEVARAVPIRTWAVPSKSHLAGFAQECAAAVLPLLEDYFGRAYVFGKLDQLGIPDFEAGAMENSGCITFREVALLLDPDKAPLHVKKRVAEVITHELAHQWFGNLVTMQWWDDLWLNEAFATWMAYKIVDQWQPGWRIWDDFDGGKAAALRLDAMDSTHPIRADVHNAEQATENFDLITYEKGGALLRMLEGYLGGESFRAGIRAYMRDHAWGNTVADDLWRALGRASNQPIEEVANGWIRQEGFPLVEVARDGHRVTVTQRRFFGDPEKWKQPASSTGAERWLVPIVMRWADDAGTHETRLLLREATDTVTLSAEGMRGEPRFVCANQNSAGFYRVNYAEADIAALARHGAALSPVERVNLIADAWALFRAGAAPLSSLLNLVVGFAGDTDYTVAGEVVGRLEMLERHFTAESDRPALRRFVEETFAPQLAALGWDAAAGEGDDTRLRRAAVVRALAIVARVPSVVEEARRRLALYWRGESARLDANLLDAASLAAARVGDAAAFDDLVARVAVESDPAAKRRHLFALASFESAPLIHRALQLTLSDVVPMQDVSSYVSSLLGNKSGQDAAWDFLRARWSDVDKKAAAPMLLRRVIESFGELTHRRAEVEAFFDTHAADLAAVPQGVKQTRERLRLDEDVHRRATPALRDWIRSL